MFKYGQGMFTFKACLGQLQDEYLSASIWIESAQLDRFNHVYCQGDLNDTLLSQACILENGYHCGNCGQNV